MGPSAGSLKHPIEANPRIAVVDTEGLVDVVIDGLMPVSLLDVDCGVDARVLDTVEVGAAEVIVTPLGAGDRLEVVADFELAPVPLWYICTRDDPPHCLGQVNYTRSW
jgi:hypothetical protein